MNRILGAAIALLTLPLFSHVAYAEDHTPFYWEFIFVDIDLQENGDMLVSETQKYVFSATAPHTNERFRRFELDRVDGIDEFHVGELDEGKQLAPEFTAGNESRRQWFTWSHALTPPDIHTFILTYRVKGGLQVYDEGDLISWEAISPDRDSPVNNSVVTVHLPESLAGQVLSFATAGVPADAYEVDDRTVEFVPQAVLQPGDELDIRVLLRHGVLNIQPPVWQRYGVRTAGFLRSVPVVGLELVSNARLRIIPFVSVAIGLLFAVLVWAKTRKWHSYYPAPNQQLENPPSDLSAASISLIGSRRVHKGTFLAMATEMIQEGILQLEVGDGSFRWRKSENYDPSESKDRPWEARIAR